MTEIISVGSLIVPPGEEKRLGRPVGSGQMSERQKVFVKLYVENGGNAGATHEKPIVLG